jgi:hypothetical protein
MPGLSTAELSRPIAFPHDLGEPLWLERRAIPVALFLGVPVAFLAAATFTTRPLGVQLLLGTATLAGVLLLLRVRRRSLIETYTISQRFVAIEQSAGGRAAIETQGLASVTLHGDTVRVEGPAGALTLAYVRRQKRFVRTLEHVAPGVTVARELDLFCPT